MLLPPRIEGRREIYSSDKTERKNERREKATGGAAKRKGEEERNGVKTGHRLASIVPFIGATSLQGDFFGSV